MKQFTHPRFRLAWLLVLIGVLNGLFWTFYRGHYENTLLQTQITLDFEDTRSLADAYGIPQQQLLADYQSARRLFAGDLQPDFGHAAR